MKLSLLTNYRIERNKKANQTGHTVLTKVRQLHSKLLNTTSAKQQYLKEVASLFLCATGKRFSLLAWIHINLTDTTVKVNNDINVEGHHFIKEECQSQYLTMNRKPFWHQKILRKVQSCTVVLKLFSGHDPLLNLFPSCDPQNLYRLVPQP